MIVLATGSASAPDKTDAYSDTYYWHIDSTIIDLGNGDSCWNGGFNGAFSNDSGSGCPHNAASVCPAAGTTVGGMNFYEGLCTMTDQDGDRAILEWACSFDPNGQCAGYLQWVGGTGKYKGIRGNSSIVGNLISGGPQGFSTWQGEWKLP